MTTIITTSYGRHEALILLSVAEVPKYRHLTMDSFELRNDSRVISSSCGRDFERISLGL